MNDTQIEALISGLGGKDNIAEIGTCMTRIRAQVKDLNKVNDDVLAKSGNKGIFKDKNEIQVVYGLSVKDVFDQVAEKLHIES